MYLVPSSPNFSSKIWAEISKKTLKFKQTCFFWRKKQGKKSPQVGFWSINFCLRQLKQLSTSPHSLSTMPPTWAKERRDSLDLFPNFPIIPKSELRGFGWIPLLKKTFNFLRLIFVLFKSKWRIVSFLWACSPLPSGSIWNHHQCSQYGSPNSVRPLGFRKFLASAYYRDFQSKRASS